MTEARSKEQALERQGRALRTLGGCNRALLRARDEASLLQEICCVMVEEAGYGMARIARGEHDAECSVTVLARAGLMPDEAEDAALCWSDTDSGRSATGTALRTGRPCLVNDALSEQFPALWREFSRRHGIGSLLSLPLRVGGELFGVPTIAAPEPDAFGGPERQVLDEVFDAVTALPNREQLRELLGQAIAAARQACRPLASVRLGLEYFRDLNETLGSAEVDTFMRTVARQLQGVVGTAGTLGRFAEGEFVVLLPQAGVAQASQLAQRLLAALYEPIEIAGLLLDARASVGCSLFPGHGADAEALMRRAGIALTQARGTGHSVALFKGSLDRDCAQRMTLMSELRGAIERDGLLLYCQPRLEVASRRVRGAEALVRWQHPRLGLVAPNDFIRLAEHTGLITPLTYWMLDAALRQVYAWHEQGQAQPLSVNLSARDLHDQGSTAIVRSTIELAHSLGLQVVAEGVEDEETLARLQALDCDMAQGYCISRPLPAEQFHGWWTGQPRH